MCARGAKIRTAHLKTVEFTEKLGAVQVRQTYKVPELPVDSGYETFQVFFSSGLRVVVGFNSEILAFNLGALADEPVNFSGNIRDLQYQEFFQFCLAILGRARTDEKFAKAYDINWQVD